MVLGVYILLFPQEEEVHFPSWGHRCTHSVAHYQKDLNLAYIMLLCQGCCWIGKSTNKKFSCVMVLIVRPSSTLKFQFIFGFNECLWGISSLLNFENFWFYIWVLVVSYLWLLILRHKWLQVTSYPMCQWPPIYITKCWKESVKGKSNFNFIRIKESSSFD